jgi:hypothetical protein
MTDEILFLDTWTNDDCTVGRLYYGDFKCLTLELPWLNNEPNVSCIPAGSYTAFKYDSPKHGLCMLFQDVSGRSMIEIHPGNYTRQIQGCILVGKSLTYLDGDSILDVTSSKDTMAKLLAVLPSEVEVAVVRS